jgi:glycogen synthase
MFGWEFPPHISGGLGTACHGLTKSLAEEDTQILFVIPKADSEITAHRVKIINASSILIPVQEDRNQLSEAQSKSEATNIISNVETIVIGSGLRPYNSPDVLSQEPSISQWNYQFPLSSFVKVKNETRVRYQFSGGYGPTLMDEVEKYAKVAEEIAGQNTFDIIHAHDWLTYSAGIAAKEVSRKPLKMVIPESTRWSVKAWKQPTGWLLSANGQKI